MTANLPFHVSGQDNTRADHFDVHDRSTGELLYHVSVPTDADVAEALCAAERGAKQVAELPARARIEILEKTAALIELRLDSLADIVRGEAGKPITLARTEVSRAAKVFRLAAAELMNWGGKHIPFEGIAGGESRVGMLLRVPRGVIFGITPFNYPFNLVAHKLAPAFATGNAMIVKPSRLTPLSAISLAKILIEAGAPSEAVSALPMSGTQAEWLATQSGVKMVTFTGGPEVGWHLKKLAYDKPVTLELGGNAAVIVDAISNIEEVAAKVAIAGVSNAGQICISVQRVYVVKEIYDAFKACLVKAVANAKFGDTRNPEVIVGPLITEKSADRIEARLAEARACGAKILVGGKRVGRFLEPTLVENPPAACSIQREEAFAPVLTITEVPDVATAIGLANASEFGLQAGIFTDNLSTAFKAVELLEFGGIIINDVPTYRSDHMPYGGIKRSGIGREGVLYAMEEMSDTKLVVFSGIR